MPKTAIEQLSGNLRKDIIHGIIKSGEHIKEKEIAVKYKVSRIPVREALMQLENEGYLVKIPRKGNFVRSLTRNSVEESLLIYETLVPLILNDAITKYNKKTYSDVEKILQKTGKKHIHEVWPHLEAYFHGAVNFAPYRNQFQTLLPNKPMRYLEVYNAAEGFFAWQDTPDNENGMLLALDHGIFFEFLPLDQLGVTENQKTCLLSEVEVGKNYAVIISTNGGLWRYNTGDTVLFLSVDPFRVRVSGRTKHFINAFGEEVMVHNTDAAIKKACEMTSSFLSDYTFAPVF